MCYLKKNATQTVYKGIYYVYYIILLGIYTKVYIIIIIDHVLCLFVTSCFICWYECVSLHSKKLLSNIVKV